MKSLQRVVIATGLMVALAGQGIACGNPMQWAMLFERHPEAKVAFAADLAARTSGLIQARPYTEQPGISYHSWSIKSVNKLALELAPSISANLQEGETLTVLLAIEVAAIRFHSGDRAPEVVTAADLKSISDYDATTTVNVLHSGWRHDLKLDSMLENELLVISGPQAVETLSAVFGQVYKVSFKP